MIFDSMPDLPPRPLTAANAAFRQRFYARWGRETHLVCGSSKDVCYGTHTQTLSIKAAWGGRERYFLREREVAVDDDHWLILNEGRAYGSEIKSQRPTASFSIFFRPSLQQEVAAALAMPVARALETPDPAPLRHVEFAEHLRRHGGAVSQRVHALRRAVLEGERDQDWLEQQSFLLVAAMLQDGGVAAPPAPRRRTAIELERRLHLAADFIDTCHSQPLALDAMAGVACLSRYHFVRHFRALHGLTPYAYLLRKRAMVARRELARGNPDREAVAQHCGFGSRFALARALKRFPADRA
ncbi:MAG: AraC family transcriptional regulator [Pseudomonadota bacterium]